MKLFPILIAFGIQVFVAASSDSSRPNETENFRRSVYDMPISSLVDRKDIVRRGRAFSANLHKIVFAVKQSNLDLIEQFVNRISDPDSDSFGHGMSRTEIVDLTNHSASCDKIIKYLESFWHGKSFTINKSKFGEYIAGT